MTPRALAEASLANISKPKLNDIIEAKCDGCGTIYIKKFSYIVKCCRNSGRMYLCLKCSNKRIATDENVKSKIRASRTKTASEVAIKLWQNKIYRAKVIAGLKNSKIDRHAISERVRKLWADHNWRTKVTTQSKLRHRSNRKTHEQFIAKSISIHGDSYDYSSAKYEHCEKPVDIICNKCHRTFQQMPMVHLRGCGCPYCPVTISNWHNEIIQHCNSLNLDIIVNDRSIGQEVDIFIKSHNIGIECHGLYWHSFNTLESTSERYWHYDKYENFKRSGISLIQLFENWWYEKSDIIKSMISYRVNRSIAVHGRQCKVISLSQSDSYKLFNSWHIHGGKYAPISYGLLYNDEIISAMSFTYSNDKYNIDRYATKLGTYINGGANKLLSKFIRDKSPKIIETFADRMVGNGNVYTNIGFIHVGVTKPNYYYVKNGKLYSRISFQKHKLKSVLEIYDEKLTEAENMFNNGYRRIWDAGHNKFRLIL